MMLTWICVEPEQKTTQTHRLDTVKCGVGVGCIIENKKQ